MPSLRDCSLRNLHGLFAAEVCDASQAYTQEALSFLRRVVFCYCLFIAIGFDRLGDCSAIISWELGCTWPETLEGLILFS